MPDERHDYGIGNACIFEHRHARVAQRVEGEFLPLAPAFARAHLCWIAKARGDQNLAELLRELRDDPMRGRGERRSRGCTAARGSSVAIARNLPSVQGDGDDERLVGLARGEPDLVAFKVNLVPLYVDDVTKSLPRVQTEEDERAPLVIGNIDDSPDFFDGERTPLERRHPFRVDPLGGVFEHEPVAPCRAKHILTI